MTGVSAQESPGQFTQNKLSICLDQFGVPIVQVDWTCFLWAENDYGLLRSDCSGAERKVNS